LTATAHGVDVLLGATAHGVDNFLSDPWGFLRYLDLVNPLGCWHQRVISCSF